MSRLKNQYDFLAGMHVKDELFFNKYTLSIDFYTVDVDDADPMDQNIAMDRMLYFIEEVVQRSIFIVEDDLKQIDLYETAGVPTLSVPQPGPFDSIVLAVLVTKLNAILDDILAISEAELTSVCGGMITYVWDEADDEDTVHEVVNDSNEGKWWASSSPRFTSYPDELDVTEVEVEHPFPITWPMLSLGTVAENAAEVVEPKKVETAKTKGDKVVKISDFATSQPKKPKPKKPKPKK